MLSIKEKELLQEDNKKANLPSPVLQKYLTTLICTPVAVGDIQFINKNLQERIQRKIFA